VTSSFTPTMAGFDWSPAPAFVPTVPGEDGWCLRDAVCKLFGWVPGSEEWSRFTTEAPQGLDTLRLVEHLRLTVFEIGASGSWDQLADRAAHPGVASFYFPRFGIGHSAYVSDVRWMPRYWPTPGGSG
jgi:hypothetical protein